MAKIEKLSQYYASQNVYQLTTIPSERKVNLDLLFTSESDIIVKKATDTLFFEKACFHHISYFFEYLLKK